MSVLVILADASTLETLHAGAAVVEIVSGAKELWPIAALGGAKLLHLHISRKMRDDAATAEHELATGKHEERGD